MPTATAEMPCVLLPAGGTGGARLQYTVIFCPEQAAKLPSGATPSEPDGGAGGDPLRGQNDTGLPEQSSHLDAPNDSLYVLCGVVIAMLLVGLIIVLLAVTISKLRKRDEPAAAQEVVLHTTGPAPAPAPQPVTIATIFGGDAAPLTVPSAVSACSLPGAVPGSGGVVNPMVNPITGAPASPPSQPSLAANGAATAPSSAIPAAPTPPPLLWQYPAPYSLYGTEQDAAVHGVLPSERPGFCRGFRRSLRGRWRRLVRRKPERDPYALPAEVRDQLKQIYVY